MGKRGAREAVISNLQAYVVSMIMVLAGAAMIYFAAELQERGRTTWASVLSNVGGAVLTTGGISILWELFSRRAFLSEVFSVAELSDDIENSGLCRITTEFQHDMEWPKLLVGAKRIDMFVSYARTWRRSNLLYLKTFAGNRGHEMNLILPDPLDDRVMAELARRFQATPEDIKYRINECKDEFINIFSQEAGGRGKLKVWFVKTAPILTYYKIDSKYVLATYRHRWGQGNIPILVCDREGDLTRFIDEEIAALTDSNAEWVRCVYPPPKCELSSPLEPVQLAPDPSQN